MLLRRRDPRRKDAFWSGADLAIDVLSPDEAARDLIQEQAI